MEAEREFRLEFRDYVAIARRRWPLALGVFAAVFLAGAAVALLLPAVYRATATILIAQQEIPREFVRSSVSTFADQRLKVINTRVMTTSRLLEIIRKHGLYAGDFDRTPREEIIERMRNDMHMDTISAQVIDPETGRPMQATLAFTVAFESRSPAVAALVANDLTSLYIEENAAMRRQEAAGTSTFLARQAEEYREQIAALEGRLADFKRENLDRMPDTAVLNQQQLARTDRELEELAQQRSRLDERRTYLETELAQLSPRGGAAVGGELALAPEERLPLLEAQRAALDGVYLSEHPEIARTDRAIAALRAQLGLSPAGEPAVAADAELDALRAERELLLEQSSALHPDVVRLDRRIAEAEARAAEQPAAAPRSTPAPRPTNPLYVQLEQQLALLAIDAAGLDDREGDLRAERAVLEQRLALAPAVERDWYALTRDLEDKRLKYREFSAMHMDAETGQALEQDDKAERFELIESAEPPTLPISPNRPLVLFLGLALALVAAGGSVVLREALDAGIRGARELEQLFGVAALGVIPTIATAEDRRARGRQRVRVAAATAVGLLALVVLAHFFVAPVDALATAALRRFGV